MASTSKDYTSEKLEIPNEGDAALVYPYLSTNSKHNYMLYIL